MEKFFIITLVFSGIIPLAFGEAFIQNDQQYTGDDGALHIVGEVKNNLEVPLNQIKIHVILFDENDHVIATKEASSLVNIIMPGMKGPFDLILTNNEAKITKSYSLELDYKISSPKNQVIDITESELSRDNYNNLMITGTVTNKGDITANTVAVIATLYDEEGNVAAVSRIHPEPDYLRTEDNAFFLVTIPDKIQTSEIEDYTLIAESEEYAAVPEFPVGSLVLLAGTLSVYIGITRYSGRIITNLISATNLK
ncbi:MAG: FxLYD domain-containing protein [Nitrosopumilus sp.]